MLLHENEFQICLHHLARMQLNKRKIRKLQENFEYKWVDKASLDSSLRYRLVVRIAGSHPAGPGSIPGAGKLILHSDWNENVKVY